LEGYSSATCTTGGPTAIFSGSVNNSGVSITNSQISAYTSLLMTTSAQTTSTPTFYFSNWTTKNSTSFTALRGIQSRSICVKVSDVLATSGSEEFNGVYVSTATNIAVDPV